MIGVFSLAAEVASIASKLKAVIASYRGAPSEATRLGETLAFFEGICLAIDRELQRSSGSAASTSRADIDGLIRSALEPCRAKLTEMDRTLGTLGSGSDVKSRLKFVCGKDMIKEMNGDLDRLVSRLQFAIGADVWICRLATVTSAPGMVLCDNHISQDSPASAPSRPPSIVASTPAELTPSPVRRIVSRTTQKVQWYRGFLGQVEQEKTVKRTRWPDVFDQGVVDEHTVVSLSTPWLPYRLGLELRKTASTTLSYALNITHIIDLESPLGQKFKRIYSQGSEASNLRQLQDSLSNRELSLSSVLRSGWGRERTLLQWAISNRLPLFCAFLFDNDPQGRMLQGTDANILKFRWVASNEQHEAADEIIGRYFSAMHDVPAVDTFEFLCQIFSDPASLLRIFRLLLRCSGQDSTEFINRAWSASVDDYTSVLTRDRIFGHTTPRRSSWEPLFRQLIRSGADVHGGMAYYNVLLNQNCPFQIIDDVREWLSMLMDCGVDIPTYLERERCEVFQKWDMYADDPDLLCLRGLTTIDFLGYKAPVWIRVTDPSGHAAEVMEEFKNVGSDTLLWSISWAEGLAKWKHEQLQKDEWPLGRSFKAVAAWAMETKNADYWPSDNREKIRHMLDAHRRRLERRWAKKAGKEKKTKGARVVMPGSWVD